MNSTFKTPATRRKSSVASNRMSSANLLKQKAMEMNSHHRQSVMTNRREGREPMIIDPNMQIGYHRDDFDVLNSTDFLSTEQYFQHQSVASNEQSMHQSYGMRNRAGFTQTDIPLFNSSQHFPREDYTFIHSSLDGQTPSTGNSQVYGTHQFNSSSFTRDSGLRAGRPTSSAKYSNGSGLQRFCRQNYNANDYLFQPPMHERSIIHPDMHMNTQPHPDFGIAPQRNQRFDYYENPFNGLDPVDRSMELSRSSFSDFAGAQHQPKNPMFVRNPYAQPIQDHIPQQQEPLFTAAQEPPKEIVLQSNDMANSQYNTVDDASLAFDDAFF